MHHVCALAAAKHLRSFVFARLVYFWPSDWLDPECVYVCVCVAADQSKSHVASAGNLIPAALHVSNAACSSLTALR